MGERELQALVSLIGSPFFYTIAFLVALLGMKKALLDQDNKGWLLIAVSALMAALPAIFNTTRTFGYAVLAPLSPSGSAAGISGVGGSSGSPSPAPSPADGETLTVQPSVPGFVPGALPNE